MKSKMKSGVSTALFSSLYCLQKCQTVTATTPPPNPSDRFDFTIAFADKRAQSPLKVWKKNKIRNTCIHRNFLVFMIDNSGVKKCRLLYFYPYWSTRPTFQSTSGRRRCRCRLCGAWSGSGRGRMLARRSGRRLNIMEFKRQSNKIISSVIAESTQICNTTKNNMFHVIFIRSWWLTIVLLVFSVAVRPRSVNLTRNDASGSTTQ